MNRIALQVGAGSALLAVILLFACGDSSTQPASCVPGASVGCVGAGACAGSQTCKSDGTFGECSCGSSMDGGPMLEAGADAKGSDGGGDGSTDAGADADAGSIDFDAATAPWGESFGGGYMYSVAVDSSQNVLLGGGGGFYGAFFVRKSDASNSTTWKKSISTGTAYAVAVDESTGDCYAAGEITASGDFGGGVAAAGYYIVKYDKAGVFQWQYGPFTHSVFNQMRVKSNGNVVVVGGIDATEDFGGGPVTVSGSRKALLVEVKSNKTFVHAQAWGGNGYQMAMGLTVDPSDNVFLSGDFEGDIDFGGGKMSGPTPGSGSHNIFIAKLDSTDAYATQMNTNTASNSSQIAALAADAKGRVYTVGGVYDGSVVNLGGADLSSDGGYDVVVGLLDGSLGHIWSKRYGDVQAQNAFAAAVDPTGAVAVTGYYQGGLDFGVGMLPSLVSTGVFVARIDDKGAGLASYGVAPSGGTAFGMGLAYLTWPDFVVVGQCTGGMMTLPSGSISCGNNGDMFAARLKP